MTIDNTQELDEILREMRYRTLEDNGLTVNGLKTIEQETKQAILDWHNKQIEAALNRLIAQKQSTWSDELADDEFNNRLWSVPVSVIEGEINKLKESK